MLCGDTEAYVEDTDYVSCSCKVMFGLILMVLMIMIMVMLKVSMVMMLIMMIIVMLPLWCDGDNEVVDVVDIVIGGIGC